MARRNRAQAREDSNVTDYRHSERRKNNPPAGLAGQGKIQEHPRTEYAYNPHLPPVLRFDPDGDADRLPELLEQAQQRKLSADEARRLAEALRNHEPWLEWAGKREKRGFAVDPVALHVHERVSAQAIVRLAMRQPLQRSLFADPELDYREAVRFYQHDVDWANRLILGDSLTVMESLARREDLAGKVQMIYVDPPYGIKFASNFQPRIGNRAVGEKPADLTREPEQIKAYRDTWTLGVHSYLSYLRDRLILARDLLSESGSIFLQIGDENVHRVRCLLDEVFGAHNFIGLVTFRKKNMPFGAKHIEGMVDYLIWYGKDKTVTKYRTLFRPKNVQGASRWNLVELADGTTRTMTKGEWTDHSKLPPDSRVYTHASLRPSGFSQSQVFDVVLHGRNYSPPRGGCWTTTPAGIQRLIAAERIGVENDNLRYRLFLDDYPVQSLHNFWTDTSGAGRKVYVVQTMDKVVQRCMLMATDPGDLVLDPTCGSGTTAYVAEQWGRRWITIDTSRVAVAIARQRLLTAKYDYYELSDADRGPRGGFVSKCVPHITLKSIAQNRALDPVFARWKPELVNKLEVLNSALSQLPQQTRSDLARKLAAKQKREGREAITEADRRRWLLPEIGQVWAEWEVPFDTDPDWPAPLQRALKDYRSAWRAKMEEVNATIAASAPQEVLVDQPQVNNRILRVSGPFTVEAVLPAEQSLDEEPLIGGEPEELDTFPSDDPTNAEAYLEQMIRFLRQDGVRFPDNKVQSFMRLEPIIHSVLHAEGEWGEAERRVAVSFGPQYGPITAKQVEDCLRAASRGGYDDLVLAGFSIDGAAQAIIQDDPNPNVRCHLAHIRPDVQMGDLLKTTASSQLFTVFGSPRVKLSQTREAEWVAEMQGVDIYDPISNTIRATRADKVAAWFLDTDYDGRTFCISQAFFPDKSAWNKIASALKTVVDPERFEAFSGSCSLPFSTGKHKRAAVKVIDPRGNEVMRVLTLDAEGAHA